MSCINFQLKIFTLQIYLKASLNNNTKAPETKNFIFIKYSKIEPAQIEFYWFINYLFFTSLVSVKENGCEKKNVNKKQKIKSKTQPNCN